MSFDNTMKWKYFANRRGSAFLTAMLFLLVLLGFGSSFVFMSIQETARASRIKKETRALALAEAGLDYAVWHVYNQTPTSYPFTLSRDNLPEGVFSAEVNQYRDASGNLVPNSIQVTSTGNSQGFTAQVKAVGHYAIAPGPNSNVFDSALFSNSDLTVKGTANINGSVHSNGNLTLQGTPTITKDASASGWIKDPKNAVQGAKTPNAPKKTMPTVDIQYYRANATTTYNSSHTFSSTTTLDGVTFVDGDVNISGQVTGKGVIVATGTIHVNGNTTLVNSATDEFALVSVSKVIVNGNCRIEGVIYCHSADVNATFSGNGTADIVGAVVADVITVNGTLKVTYKKPTVELPGSSDSPVQVDLVSWRRLK